MKVMIDPGHGGADPGAVRGTTKESDINLSIATSAGWLMKQRGITVAYTRASDKFLKPTERVALANASGADFFLSVHCNAAENADARGLEVWHYKTDERGLVVARAIWREVMRLPGWVSRQPGVKASTTNIYVLRMTKMPAALIECAFISNEEDRRMLELSDIRKRVAQGIAEGVTQCAGLFV